MWIALAILAIAAITLTVLTIFPPGASNTTSDTPERPVLGKSFFTSTFTSKHGLVGTGASPAGVGDQQAAAAAVITTTNATSASSLSDIIPVDDDSV